MNRKNIIEKSGLKFEISASTFEENLPHTDFQSSHDYVVETSRMKLIHKLQEFKQKNEKADIFITADTIISFDDKIIIEKPQDKEHAFKILKEITTRGSHDVFTSVWIAFVNTETMEIN